MHEFLDRSDFDDALREITDHRRAQSARLADLERWFAEATRREMTFRSELLRLRSLLFALATPAQRELFARELAAGVHDVGEFVEAANLHADFAASPDRAPKSPHRWQVGDLCVVVIQDFGRPDSPRCWNAFFDEADADDFLSSMLKVHLPDDCDAALVRKTLAQVTSVDTLANAVLAFDEHSIVL